MKARLRDFFVYALAIFVVVFSCYLLQRFSTKTNVQVTEGDFSLYLLDKKAPIILYGTSWCHYCASARDFLNKKGISYVDLDIEQSPQALKEYSALGGGGVPLLVIGSRKIQGFSEIAIKQSIELLHDKK